MQVKVQNGEVIEVGLPETGYLSDGAGVSNYHLLDERVLRDEGWLPLIENRPNFNELTQKLVFTGYRIESDSVVANYVAESKQPTEANYLLEIDFRLSMLELELRRNVK